MKIYPQIRRSLYHFKQDIIHHINPERCQYTLLEKSKKINIEQYKKLSSNAPEIADSFTFVTIGKKDDEKYRKKITTFYSGKRIVERLFESSDGKRILREYKHTGYNTSDSCRYTRVIQKTPSDEKGLFSTDFIKEMRTYKSEMTGRIKLEIQQNIIKGNKIEASITEYPFGRSKNKFPGQKKVLGVTLEFDNGIPHITGTVETPNVKFPLNDKFLPFRFIIDEQTKIKSLTRFFIHKKDLDKLGIKIDISDTVAKNSAGYFSESEGKIAYNINELKNLADLSGHEVEHAYQHRQIGRIGKGRTEYERKSLKYYGEIDGIKEGMEAHKYAVASENYPRLKDDEDLSKNMAYQNNYLEIKAREAGEKLQKEYDELGKEINKQFFFGLQ